MRVSAFIIIVLLASCLDRNQEDYRGFTKRTLKLVDSLGEIELMLPDYYDALHSWVMMGEDRCYAKRCYRYQPSNYPLTEQKNGTFTKHDSIEHYLTISRDYYLSCCWPQDSLICKPYKSGLDTIIQFESHGRQYCYSSFVRLIKPDGGNPNSFWNNAIYQYAKAYVHFNDLTVSFEFRTLNSDYAEEDFNQECLKILKSMKITGNGVQSLWRDENFDPKNRNAPDINRVF